MTSTKMATGDALKMLRVLPSQSIHCCVTSPPYWLLRDYEISGQLGRERSPDEYVSNLVAVIDEVWRVLRNDGTCWVVLGDTYFGSNKGADSGKPRKETFVFQLKPKETGGKAKCLAQIPARFGVAMADRGWVVRNRAIWHKPNVIPSSAVDRLTVDYEDVLFFTKRNKRYYFDQQFTPLKQSTKGTSKGNARQGQPKLHKNLRIPGQRPHGMHLRRAGEEVEINGDPRGANMRTVISVAVARCPYAHFAVYPEALIKPLIKAGCPEHGIVLDPFCGSGTTAIVSEKLGRSFLGIELNPDYVEIAKKRIRQARQRNRDLVGNGEILSLPQENCFLLHR